MAVDVVVPSSPHCSDGGAGAGTTSPFPISSSTTTLVHTSAAICIAAASAYVIVVPTLLSHYATFAVSLVCFARAVWPDRVDAALVRARADLEADLRRLSDAARRRGRHPAMAARVYAAAGATVACWACRARRKWDEHRDAARAARFVLRLVALVARLAATVLFDAACDEARAWAPSVMGYLRRVVDGIRPPPPSPSSSSSSSCDKGVVEDEAAAAAGLTLQDIVCLVGTCFYLLFTMHLLFGFSAASGVQFCAVCFAATCGLTMLIADWIDPPDDDDDADDGTDDTTAGTDDDEGDAAGKATSRDEELEVRESWRFLWVLVLVTHCVDAFLLHVTLGPQPTTLAILALCNFEVLKVGRQAELTPDGDDDGAVDKWRRGAMVVYAACSVKILVVYLVLDCYLAALGFLWLFVMADLLLAEEDNLADFDASGEVAVDDEDGESAAGFQGDKITGGAEGELDEEARKEHSNTSSSSEVEDDETSAHCDCDSSSEDREESSAQYDRSEEHEVVDEEQRQHEEPDYGSSGSTDDSWDLVDVDDPEMPAKANCRANRKSRRLFPWKHAA